MTTISKEKHWFKPLFECDETVPIVKKAKKLKDTSHDEKAQQSGVLKSSKKDINQKNVIKKFDPVTIEELAVNKKKIEEVEQWVGTVCDGCHSNILLLTGPVGCGKTATVHAVAAKYNVKVTEWVTPIDIDIPSEFGNFEFKEKQSTKFLDFILNAANFTSLLDNNNKKLVLVEDFPNTFIKTPSEFTDVLHQYKQKAKSPIVFICSESHTDTKNSVSNLFSPSLQEQFQVHHISFNSIPVTGLKSALKRVADIINKSHTTIYNTPSSELIECVVNSSGGDVRSAVLNLHFACLKGSNLSLETSIVLEKETKGKSKSSKKKKTSSSKFLSVGKDQTVSILHGVGRVLNPKVIVTEAGQQKFTHAPSDIIEQFVSQPGSFVNFIAENYLTHFSCCDQVDMAASVLSDADFMLAEWREKLCQEYGLYTAIAGLMVANKNPVSAWNPVRGPKNMKIQYPSLQELPQLERNYLYKGKVLVTDYQTYCKIIGNNMECEEDIDVSFS